MKVLSQGRTAVANRLPGVMTCAVVALAATFLSEHYGGPQLLYALLIGLAFHFLISHPQTKEGVDFCGRTLLRLGVALLGVRITLPQVTSLGAASAAMVFAAVMLTIAFGVLLAKWLGRPREEGLLSGCAVGICGASAALAVSSVLPQTKENERFTLLVVVGVTVMSTLAMIIYPLGLGLIGFTPNQSGVFLGGTIHDVAQVVAAGMILGPQTADIATIVKLFRVMLLMPVVLVVAILYRNHPSVEVNNDAVPLVPGFLIAFIALMLLASLGTFTPVVTKFASDGSRSLLVTAIAAVGIKTSFEDLLKLGWKPLVMLVGDTLFIAGFVLAMIFSIRLVA
ncbi:MAG: YeiH family protein [Polaromonas sp.]